MLKAHKNLIFLTLNNSRYNINDFDFQSRTDPDTEKTLYVITYKPYDGLFQYMLEENPDEFNSFLIIATEFSPRFPLVYRHGSQYHSPISFIPDDIIIWLDREVMLYAENEDIIDLWDQFSKGASLVNIEQPLSDDTSSFTIYEREQISIGLNQMKLQIPTQFKLDDLQLESINNRIDYLIEAAGRTNKTDWNGILIAQFVSLVTTLALNPDQAKNLWNLFIQVLHIIPLIAK